MSYTSGDQTVDEHLNSIGNGRRSRPRRSIGRTSVGSASSVKSFQNVTNSLNVNKIEQDLADTENSIRILRREINNVEKRTLTRSQAGETEPLDLDWKDDDEYFLRHSRPRTYKPRFTIIFVAVCFVMFIISLGANGFSVEDPAINPLIGPSVETLIQLGAKDTELLQDGEVHRLFLPIILHVGFVHLLINLIAIVVIGLPMEQEFGTLKIAAIAISSGVGGIILSALLAPNLVTVGASGAIFGLIGAAWGDLLQNWHIYRGKNKMMLLQLTLTTLINFVFGLMPFVDNFAHIGGFLIGLTLGTVLLVKQYGEIKQRRGLQIVLRVTSVLILPVGVAIMLFLLFLGFDVATNCGGCDYFSCVEFPFGADEADLWWRCGRCFNGFGSFENFTGDGFVTINCPDGTSSELPIDPQISEEEFEDSFAFTCDAECDE